MTAWDHLPYHVRQQALYRTRQQLATLHPRVALSDDELECAARAAVNTAGECIRSEAFDEGVKEGLR